MKKLQKLIKSHKELLTKNKYNPYSYLVERDLPEGVMFVDRMKTHRLYHDKQEKSFTRLEV